MIRPQIPVNIDRAEVVPSYGSTPVNKGVERFCRLIIRRALKRHFGREELSGQSTDALGTC